VTLHLVAQDINLDFGFDPLHVSAVQACCCG